MIARLSQFSLALILLTCSACVLDPGYYGPGYAEPAPAYGYYGYGPAYPWNTGVSVDIGEGWGHGGYYGGGGYRGGYGGGYGRGGGGYGGGRGGGRR